MKSAYSPSSYRYPHEQIILTLTLLLVFGVIVFTATATVCGSVLFVAAMLIIAYFATSNRHQSLLKTAQEVTPQTNPRLNDMVEECRATLQTEAVQTFVANRNALNAYTFGLTSPKVVVIYSALGQVLDEEEAKFIIDELRREYAKVRRAELQAAMSSAEHQSDHERAAELAKEFNALQADTNK